MTSITVSERLRKSKILVAVDFGAFLDLCREVFNVKADYS